MAGIDLSLDKAAQFFGVVPRTIHDWLRAGMPGEKNTRGHWAINSAAASNWLRDRERESALGEVAKVDEQEARRRKLVAEAGREELKLAIEQGKLIPLVIYEASLSAMIGAARAKLLGMSAKLGPLVATCTAQEAREMIHAEIVDVLQELREFDGSEELAGFGEDAGDPIEPEDGESLVAAADANDIGVGGPEQTPKPRSKRRAG